MLCQQRDLGLLMWRQPALVRVAIARRQAGGQVQAPEMVRAPAGYVTLGTSPEQAAELACMAVSPESKPWPAIWPITMSPAKDAKKKLRYKSQN